MVMNPNANKEKGRTKTKILNRTARQKHQKLTKTDRARKVRERTRPTKATSPLVNAPEAPTWKDADDRRNALAAVLAAGAGDCDGDLFARVGELLGTEADASSAIRLPLAEDYAGNALAGMRLLARVQAESAKLSARLQGLVQASRMDRPRPVRSGRRLDPKRLHRVAVADERIFSRRAHRIAPDTAVHLLVDLSGSMHATVHRTDGSPTTRASSALESALALALALEGIPGRDGGHLRVSGKSGNGGSGDADGPARPEPPGLRGCLHPDGARRDADGPGPVVRGGGSPRSP